MRLFYFFLLLILPAAVLAAPGNDRDSTDALPTLPGSTPAPPKIFLNCANTRCYDDFIRTELSFFDFVRDRYVCEVEVLMTSFNTAAGGREYAVTFLGQGRYQGQGDTLKFVTRQTDTEDMVRKQLVRTLRQGLVRYLVDSELLQHLSISYPKRKAAQEAAAVARDPWNFWVFTVGGSGSISAESNRRFSTMEVHGRINRITAKSKFNVSTNYNENRSRYRLNEQDIRVRNVQYGLSALYVASFSEHWSAGGFYRGYHSVYQNIAFAQTLAPALEYSVFPISDVMRRQLRWVYKAGVRRVNYLETTIFDKLRETLPFHQVTGIFGLTQPWGTLSAEFTGYQYLHDATKNRLSLEMELAWRVLEGLSFRINGSASLINNQISLAKSSINTEDALLNGRQLPTNFNYYSSVGLNFTFGSINNSVVNPRFSGVD
jgi:hypothetical protein